MEPVNSQRAPTETSIKRLTLAIWVVAAVLLAQVIVSVVPFIFPNWFFSKFSETGFESHPIPEAATELPRFTSVKENSSPPDTHTMTGEEQIAAASAIILSEIRPEGDKYQWYVTEIVKDTTGGELSIKVGDQYPRHPLYPEPNSKIPEGSLVFTWGEIPTEWHTSYIYDNRIPSFGGMPVSKLRDLVANGRDDA